MPDGGTYAADGSLLCASCTSAATVTAANATIVTAERQARDRKEMAKVGGLVAAGFGVSWIMMTVIAVVVFMLLASLFVKCVQSLPHSFNVG
jgi:hypothetical protein